MLLMKCGCYTDVYQKCLNIETETEKEVPVCIEHLCYDISKKKTEYERMKKLFKDLKIGFTENFNEISSYKTIFIHQSNITFNFNMDEKYIIYDIAH